MHRPDIGEPESVLPDPGDPAAFLAAHSRTFHLATSLFPAGERIRVQRLYAYCRVTDDLADGPGEADREQRERWLSDWLAASRAAHDGRVSGVAVIDEAMADMAGAGVPFDLAAELVEGMRMDLRHTGYPTLADLELYCYRVAGVVGIWMCRLFGVDDDEMLRRAAGLGRGMQLTNILRDVGEDWRRGRVYLPTDMLARRGLTTEDVGAFLRRERPIDADYARVLEDLIEAAEADYAAAMEVLPRLPRAFRRPAAVAAHVYRGLHDEIRRSGYDNLHRRNRVGRLRGWSLALRAMLGLPARRNGGTGVGNAGRQESRAGQVEEHRRSPDRSRHV